MNRLILIFFLLSPCRCSLTTNSARSEKQERMCLLKSTIITNKLLVQKCMANDLFTLPFSVTSGTTGTTVVNEAYSDNIGPFEIRGGGWWRQPSVYGRKDPNSRDFLDKTYADGQSISSDTLLKAQIIKLEVKTGYSIL